MWTFFITVRLYLAQLKLKQSHVLRDANQSVLNCGRFSYFWPFTHDIITQNTTHSIWCRNRSSRPEVFYKKVVLRNFGKFTGNTFARVSFLIELIFNFFKKEFLTQVFSCELCESSKNTFSYRTPPVAASVQARFCGILWLSVYCVHKLHCRSNNKIKNNEVMSWIN